MNTPPLHTYLDLCTEVYELSKPVPPKDSYEFYRKYAYNSKGQVLEPMCGTGSFLLPLLAEGINIAGFDASFSMLKKLNQKAHNQNLAPKVWQGYLQDLNRGDRYELIFIPRGSFGLIIDMEEVKNCLSVIYSHLSNTGLFVFEIENLKYPRPPSNVWRGSSWYRTAGDWIISSFLTTPISSSNIETTVCKYELVNNNHVIKTEIEFLKIQLYEKNHMFQLLREVGFKSIRAIKAFDPLKESDSNDEVFVFECKKT